MSLLWLRLEQRARTSLQTLLKIGFPIVFEEVSNNCNVASGHARHLLLVSNPMFLGMGNHLGPFSGSSYRPEGQELGGGAVGGQEGLQEVKF